MSVQADIEPFLDRIICGDNCNVLASIIQQAKKINEETL